MPRLRRLLALCALLLCLSPVRAQAQIVEAVGGRALGMGGAFVALADDSSATWWNPAGLAAGPFLDVAAGWGTADIEDGPPGRRQRAGWVSLGTPPFGFSYYRLKDLGTGLFLPIAPDGAGREDRRAAVPTWSRGASQIGATLVHTLLSGIHAGATLKYVRANSLGGEVIVPESAGVDQVLDQAARLKGDSHGNFDLDVGVLAIRGPVRIGGVVRNVREAEYGLLKMPRQFRLGAAIDTTVGTTPIRVALDADASAYPTAAGDRRVVAIGGEGWALGRKLGLRAGARFNTTGLEERVATAGASVAIRTGMYVEAFFVRGGLQDERGWGIAARASF